MEDRIHLERSEGEGMSIYHPTECKVSYIDTRLKQYLGRLYKKSHHGTFARSILIGLKRLDCTEKESKTPKEG